jgi:hypothetical protein
LGCLSHGSDLRVASGFYAYHPVSLVEKNPLSLASLFSLPLDILMQFRLHNCHEYHVRQNCIILLVVALLGGPGFGVLTKKHLQTAVGETTAVFLYYFP